MGWAVNAQSLEPFKARLDGAVSNLVKREVSAYSMELELRGLKGSFQPKPFYDYLICHVCCLAAGSVVSESAL